MPDHVDPAAHVCDVTRFPDYTFTTLQDPEAIDEVAAEAARMIVAGDLDDTEGRLFIGGLLFFSKMPTQVTRAALAKWWPNAGSQRQVREDLMMRCVDLLQKKVADPSYFDVAGVANGSSFTGWARNLLTGRFGVQSELRNLTNDYHKAIPASQRIGVGDEQVCFAGSALRPDHEFDNAGFTAALAAYSDQAHGAREQHRKHLDAAALCQALDLPRVKTLPTAAARNRVAKDLEEDPKVAYRVVSQLRAGLVNGQDSQLALVFAGFSPDDLETVAEKDWRVAAVLATAAAAATPPVVQKVASELIREFVALVQPGSPAAHMAKLTVRAWLVASTTMIGDEFSHSWTFKSDEQIEAEAAEFVKQATRLVRRGSMPGMVTVKDVEQWLEAACERLQIGHATRTMDARAGSMTAA